MEIFRFSRDWMSPITVEQRYSLTFAIPKNLVHVYFLSRPVPGPSFVGDATILVLTDGLPLQQRAVMRPSRAWGSFAF